MPHLHHIITICSTRKLSLPIIHTFFPRWPSFYRTQNSFSFNKEKLCWKLTWTTPNCFSNYFIYELLEIVTIEAKLGSSLRLRRIWLTMIALQSCGNWSSCSPSSPAKAGTRERVSINIARTHRSVIPRVLITIVNALLNNTSSVWTVAGTLVFLLIKLLGSPPSDASGSLRGQRRRYTSTPVVCIKLYSWRGWVSVRLLK